MTCFDVFGPFKIHRYSARHARIIRSEEGKTFFQETRVADLANRQGAYVFGVQAGKGIRPYYVGKAEKTSFERECFTVDKIEKYNRCLADRRGTPVMFFVALAGRRSKSAREDIAKLEEFLIQTAVTANPELLNKRGTKRPTWSITGVLGPEKGRGKPTDAAVKFRRSMKMPKSTAAHKPRVSVARKVKVDPKRRDAALRAWVTIRARKKAANGL